MKINKLNVIKNILDTIGTFAFCWFAFWGMISCVENIMIQEEAKDFIESAVYEKTEGRYHYYAVYTDEVIEPTITYDLFDNPNLGYTGDFFLTGKSNMDVAPFVAEFISFYYGGHAGVIGYDDKRHVNSLVEALGGSLNENYVDLTQTSDILKVDKRNFIGMRVKNATMEEREKAWDYAKTLVGKPYNYSFLLNTKNSYYCTDLVARIYGKENDLDFNLEWNGFATSTQDLFLSKDAYISFIKIYKDQEYHIYYLKTRGE